MAVLVGFVSWSGHVRAAANSKRLEMGIGPIDAVSSDELCRLLESTTGIQSFDMPHGDPLLGGAIGVLDLDSDAIWLDESLTSAVRNATCIHEFGHFFLHAERYRCDDNDVAAFAEIQETAVAMVDGYSPRQRRETEANTFAAEFLLPHTLAKDLFVTQGMSAGEIASKLNIAFSLVCAQLAVSVLIEPNNNHSDAVSDNTVLNLNQSQLAAAHAENGPVLVGAGPGTGKTSCLIERCRYLIDEVGVAPQQILMLTFSRKAAQEMRDRLYDLQIAKGEASPWVGTFHSFGLEVLQRFGSRLGIKEGFALLTPDDCDTLLENNLAALNLEHFDFPDYPSRYIPEIRKEISRAKGEQSDPARYLALTESSPDSDRPKLWEIARCYRIYEALLKENNAVDFDDLIVRALELLEKYPEVALHLQNDYPHILADEYQDVNAASRFLLRRLAGENAQGLWAVGDERQTIYRFRGASPANIELFHHDYPAGQRCELDQNYRSVPKIVELATEAAKALDLNSSEMDNQGWRPVRSPLEQPPIIWASSDSEIAQAENIAATIKSSEPGDLSQIAVLCRNHKKASFIARELAGRDVPALYVGELLSYKSVKDILSIMSAAASDTNLAIQRMAQMPMYNVPHSELQQIASGEQPTPLSANGEKLLRDLRILSSFAKSPALLLDAILWQVVQYGRTLSSGPGSTFEQAGERLAVNRLRTIAAGFEHRPIRRNGCQASPIDEFISFFNNHRQSGSSVRTQDPDEAASINAVRVMTIHASKGLGFDTVFMPYLQTRQFPPVRHRSDVPALSLDTDTDDSDLDEEKCLFFVAMTRAKNRVIFSRVGKSDSGRNISMSPLLSSIAPWLRQNVGDETSWQRLNNSLNSAAAETSAIEAQQTAPEARHITLERRAYSASELGRYRECPRRYFYERRLGITEDEPTSSNQKFHQFVRRLLHELQQECAAGQNVDITESIERLWPESRLAGDLHEEYYRGKAATMLKNYFDKPRDALRPLRDTTLTVALDNASVRFRPDAIYYDRRTKEFVFVSQKTGKPSKSDTAGIKFAVWRKVASGRKQKLRIEIHYLSTGETALVPTDLISDIEALALYNDAAIGIGSGQFDPVPGDACLRCPFWLACPASE